MYDQILNIVVCIADCLMLTISLDYDVDNIVIDVGNIIL